MAKREQKKLLFMVMSVGMVLLLFNEARKPSTWRWVTNFGEDVDATANPVAAEDELIDTRVRPHAERTLPPGTFISEPDPIGSDAPEDYFPGVEPANLRALRDDTVLSRPGEFPAWQNLIRVLADNPAEDFENASVGEVGFVQLHQQPAEYRGKVVTLTGYAKQALFKEASSDKLKVLATEPNPPEGEQPKQGYYRIVMRADGGPPLPIFVYALELPEGFPTGKRINEEIAVHGFFYKNQAYLTEQMRDGVRQTLTAPLVLSRTLDWEPPVVEVREPPATTHIVLMFVATAIFGIAIAAYVYWQSRLDSDAASYTPMSRMKSDSLDQLQDADLGPDTSDVLRDMEKQERDRNQLLP